MNPGENPCCHTGLVRQMYKQTLRYLVYPLALGLLGACSDSSQPGSGASPAEKVLISAPPAAPIPQTAQTVPDALSQDKPAAPTKELISAWWKSHAGEDMTIEGGPLAIHLLDKERAYLVSVGFYGRGRNDIWHTVMVRPSLKEVHELSEVGSQDIQVLDLDGDGVSEVAATSVGSGQGTEVRVRTIVQFDGWSPVTLREARSEQGCGFVGDQMNCHRETVTWTFSDLDGDGVLDLVEEVESTETEGNGPKKTSKSTHQLLFKNRQFSPKPG